MQPQRQGVCAVPGTEPTATGLPLPRLERLAEAALSSTPLPSCFRQKSNYKIRHA